MDIAVIGMHCRLPGANNPREFWDLVKSGKSRFSSLKERPFFKNLNTSCQMQGLDVNAVQTAGLIDDPYAFDSDFFNLSGKEADVLDPQTRLLLESTNGLLEDSSLSREQLVGTNTALFIGLSSSDYLQDILVNMDQHEALNIYHATGNSASAAVGRLAYSYDWKGPAIAIDTACSSSLVAISQACDALELGKTDLAVSGGVNLILSHLSCITFSQAKMTSPTGQCRPFDKEANGYVRGEGCTLVMLKRLPDALRDKDNIHAVIKSHGVNHDGHSNGITAPNSAAQAALITQCWKDQNIHETGIDYIEAHGTGTRLGDPVEIKALSSVIKAHQLKEIPVGSLKSNIGHLEAAAGATGFIKAILVGKHKLIPPQADFSELNPLLHRYKNEVHICNSGKKIDKSVVRVCVSSFGFSGTNAHILLDVTPQANKPVNSIKLPVTLGISAKNKTSLLSRLDDLENLSLKNKQINLPALIAQTQYSEQYPIRTAIMANNLENVISSIEVAKINIINDRSGLSEELAGKMMKFRINESCIRGQQTENPDYLCFASYQGLYHFLTKSDAGNNIININNMHYSAEIYSLVYLLVNQGLKLGVFEEQFSSKDIIKEGDFVKVISLLNGFLDVNSARGPVGDNELVIEFGNDLRIIDDRLSRIYSDSQYKNTQVTLGILYSCGLINRLPEILMNKPVFRHLPTYPFNKKDHYHNFVAEQKQDDMQYLDTCNFPELEEYTENWQTLDLDSSNVSHADDPRCYIVDDHGYKFNELINPSIFGSFEVLPASSIINHDIECSGKTLFVHLYADSLADINIQAATVVEIYKAVISRNSEAGINFHCFIDINTRYGAILYETIGGFMATVALENPAVNGLMIAVDAIANEDTWLTLGALERSTASENELFIKITGNKCYVKKLSRTAIVSTFNDPDKPCPWHKQSVIITGGSSGIGLTLARYIASYAVAELILIGRREITSEIKQIIKAVQSNGGLASYLVCDIAEQDAVYNALKPVLKGNSCYRLIHAAGDAGEEVGIADTNKSHLDKAWSGKVDGLLNITSVLTGKIMSIYLFSSISALWGWSGKSCYAMANGFLKGLANTDIFTGKGRSVETVCHLWGVWSESGILQRSGAENLLEYIGLYTHTNQEGFETIAKHIGTGSHSAVMAKLNPGTVAANLTRASGLFEYLREDADSQAISHDEQLQPIDKADVTDFIVTYLQQKEHFQLAAVEDRFRGFYDLGLNSLVVVELCAELGKRFGVSLTPSDLFNAPTIDKLADLVFNKTLDSDHECIT
jgi:3-oxoacyl-(acyl-carrier-protein) synthase/acyl carrier protein